MDNTLLKSLFSAVLLILLNVPSSLAETKDLIDFNLSLAEYTLGMTYDDALSIRTLHFIQDLGSDSPEAAEVFFDAYAEQVYVDGIEMNLWLRFKNERLYKIIAHFTPDKTKEITNLFNQALGQGEDKSRLFPNHEGSDIRQTVYFWDYPTAKLHLVRTSDNDKYATIGLTSKPAYAATFSEEDN